MFRFISMINRSYENVNETHRKMLATNEQILIENNLASKLRKQLDHEKIVWQERKAVSGKVNIMYQGSHSFM